ncbi:hypothetical protein LJC63_07860 [Ruminococcaceae bacterium OttesenSCG-928-L11]|nr:hypothetical protein [Ruminococcaceae bacterium OttesenSCG-928-L11]
MSSDGDGGDIIVFDLASALVCRPDADGRISREPEYPQKWGDGFGMSIEEHRRSPLLRRFAEDTELVLASAAEVDMPTYNNDDMEDGDEQ